MKLTRENPEGLSDEVLKHRSCPRCGKYDPVWGYPGLGSPQVLCPACAAPQLLVAYLPPR